MLIKQWTGSLGSLSNLSRIITGTRSRNYYKFRHRENFRALTRPRIDFGLIFLISNMIIHRRFTGPTHLLSANVCGPVSVTVSVSWWGGIIALPTVIRSFLVWCLGDRLSVKRLRYQSSHPHDKEDKSKTVKRLIFIIGSPCLERCFLHWNRMRWCDKENKTVMRHLYHRIPIPGEMDFILKQGPAGVLYASIMYSMEMVA